MNDAQTGYKATQGTASEGREGGRAVIHSGNVVLEASEEQGPCCTGAAVGRCPYLQPSPGFQALRDPGHPR